VVLDDAHRSELLAGRSALPAPLSRLWALDALGGRDVGVLAGPLPDTLSRSLGDALEDFEDFLPLPFLAWAGGVTMTSSTNGVVLPVLPLDETEPFFSRFVSVALWRQWWKEWRCGGWVSVDTYV